MIQFWELGLLSAEQLSRIVKRAETDITALYPLAQDVIEQVKMRGDSAVVEFARKFDAPEFDTTMIRASQEDFDTARSQLSSDVINAIEAAHNDTLRFHDA